MLDDDSARAGAVERMVRLRTRPALGVVAFRVRLPDGREDGCARNVFVGCGAGFRTISADGRRLSSGMGIREEYM